MTIEFEEIEKAILGKIASAENLSALLVIEKEELGKNSAFATARKNIGSLTPEERKSAGQQLHRTKQAVEEAFSEKQNLFLKHERAETIQRERIDLTETLTRPRVGHEHIVTQAWEELEDVFIGMGFTVADGPQAETDWHNFDALNIPPDHPARDGFDTLYVDYGDEKSTLLRTHTSPVQIRTMLDSEPPIYIVAPGRVFRRDTADATHMPVFHQIEGLVIDKDISMAHLAGTIEAFTEAYFGKGFTSRLRPNHFPFTEPSAEFDIQRPDGSWLELGGCGMVHPKVLKAGGIDPEEWSGFAFGFGIDRLALLKFGVSDLREIFTNDVRFLSQF